MTPQHGHLPSVAQAPGGDREGVLERQALVDLPTSARHRTIYGVGFFDKKHHQIGLADNGIELHLVLTFKSSNCRSG